jgi:hypothetical protein
LRINIQALGVSLTASLLDHTERRLRFAFGTRRIKRVVICLGETNISRRGADKFCRIQVYLEQAAPVLIEDTDTDLYAVIERVAERAGRSVAMSVDQRHEYGGPGGLAQYNAIATKREVASMGGR